jgi:hypothetical protein
MLVVIENAAKKRAAVHSMLAGDKKGSGEYKTDYVAK